MTPLLVHIALGLATGYAVGVIHFTALVRVTALYLAGGGATARAAALQLARFALLGAVLFGLARIGAPDLIAGTLGVVLARETLLRRARKEVEWTAR